MKPVININTNALYGGIHAEGWFINAAYDVLVFETYATISFRDWHDVSRFFRKPTVYVIVNFDNIQRKTIQSDLLDVACVC